jgi:ribonuclease J
MTHSVNITFYGGVNEIGGNKILLEDRDTKIFLDFGESFTCDNEYFVDWLQPRAVAGLKDYFEFGLVPKLKGLYSRDALRFTDLKYEEPKFDAVFLSHAHYDHIAHLAFVDERVPSTWERPRKKFWRRGRPAAGTILESTTFELSGLEKR